MKVSNLGILVLLASLTACSSRKNESKNEEVVQHVPQIEKSITIERMEKLTQGWPQTSKLAAKSMINKYGLPKEASPSMLLWERTGPFKRTIVYREEVAHNFPFGHFDVLEQVVDYRVPGNMVRKLHKFDGSLLIDRTKGELSSRCDKEEMNLLALNLADEIIRGMRSPEEARIEFAHSAQEFMTGNASRYNTALMFVPGTETFDKDLTIKNFRDMKGSLQAEEAIQAEEAQGSLESDNLEL